MQPLALLGTKCTNVHLNYIAWWHQMNALLVHLNQAWINYLTLATFTPVFSFPCLFLSFFFLFCSLPYFLIYLWIDKLFKIESQYPRLVLEYVVVGNDPPSSTSQTLRLQMFAITPRFFILYFNHTRLNIAAI